MASSKQLVELRCKNPRCNKKFAGYVRLQSIVCQSIRQHINKSPRGRPHLPHQQPKQETGLISHINSRNRKHNVDLRSSMVSEPTKSTDNPTRKRKAPFEPPNVPPPKKVTIMELSPTFLQEKFGAHPQASSMLRKGQSFSAKANLVRIYQWKAPDNKIMNDLFCNGGTNFNHFSTKAIILDPKLEHLANPKLPFPGPPSEIVFNVLDDFSFVSSVVSNTQEDNDDGDDDDENDAQSFASDYNVDGGSVLDEEDNEEEDDDSNQSTQRMGNLNHHTNGRIGDWIGDAEAVATTAGFSEVQMLQENTTPAIPNPPEGNAVDFSLLQRWKKQCQKNSILPDYNPDPLVVSELGLLHIQHKYGLSLEAVKAVKKWAHTSYKSSRRIFQDRPASRKKQLKMIRTAMGIEGDDKFQEIAIDWLPENKKRPIHVRTFSDCIYELLSNEELLGHRGENISLPHPEDPYKQQPDCPPNFASELHHGWWWMETVEKLCDEQKQEILVPIIGYMDGVSTDNNGRLPVTPLNITIGILNTETRRQPEAWTTILLYPDDSSEASVQEGTKTIHKIQNLHNCISVAFREMKEIMDSGKSIPWELKYGKEGKTWKVFLKFSFAYVIGDTEMHDKLCGRYGPRTRTVKSICRHCTCTTDLLCEGGEIFEGFNLYTPEMLDPETHCPEYFKSISHHPIRNAFHELDFGANRFNIHLASPGELLHMVQKGVCTRSIEGFVNMWKDPNVEQDDITAVTNQKKSSVTLDKLDRLGKVYGGYLSRQSDRNKPRTKFRSSLFKNCKKNGHEHTGVIMDVLCAILLNRGRQIIAERGVDERWVENYVYLFEVLLQFEQFMKMKDVPLEFTMDERLLGKAMDHLLETIDGTIHRGEKTMGNNTAKNHLLAHIPQYASRFGPLTGMDSGDSERNHKFIDVRKSSSLFYRPVE